MHPSNKRSKKNLDFLYEMLAPGTVVQKTDQNTLVFREPGKLKVTDRISSIAKFGTRDERKTQLTEYNNRRGSRNFEKSTEAKILSQIKELKRIQKGDRKMKHRKGDTTSVISPNRSNIARAMRVRMPKVPPNLAPPENSFKTEAISAPQVTT